jgi:predicted amidophosphoribosyltransferase
VLDDLLDALLPARCPGCGGRGRPLCDGCATSLHAAPNYPPPAPVDWWTACFSYEGAARELIARAKYRAERRALDFAIPALVANLAAAPVRPDAVTWIPASRARVRAHGLDHGASLARTVARLTGLPVQRCFERGPGPAQTGRDARARRNGPELRVVTRSVPPCVLVVDDVATTGGSLAAAARALRAAGAERVLAATLARTRRPGDGAQTGAYTFATPAEPRTA